MDIKSKMYRVIKNRKTQYMDYQDFCDLLPILKNAIHIECDLQGYKIDLYSKEKSIIDGEIKSYQNNVEFTKTMLAMKAIRSLTATKNNFYDCIIDFVNYKMLSLEALNTHLRSNIILDFNICFDTQFFNKELNYLSLIHI